LHLHKTAGSPGFPVVWMAVSVLVHDKNGTKSGQDTRLPEGKMIRYAAVSRHMSARSGCCHETTGRSVPVHGTVYRHFM